MGRIESQGGGYSYKYYSASAMADSNSIDVGSSEAAMAAAPIAFDSAEQLDEVLERIWTALDGHIQDKCNEMARSTGNSDTTSLRRMIEEELRARLPGYIQQNITVRGMSWEEHQQKAHMGGCCFFV